MIFFARYEASQYGSPCVEPFHVLLGLVREDKLLLQTAKVDFNQIRKIYERLHPDKKPRIPVSVEIPLSFECKSILSKAADQADTLGHKYVGPEHLFLSMLAGSREIRDELAKVGLSQTVTLAFLKEFEGRKEEKEVHDAQAYFVASGVIQRSGVGYDLHRLEAGRKLRIGGIDVAFDKGSVGHSDGDVLAHSICDALLGAASLGDIGTHFPDTDPKWKGADSLEFLRHVRTLYDKEGLHIFHIDAIVIAERPKLGPHFPAMREALAGALGIEIGDINLKAKTNEGVDAIGRGEAIAAYAVASIAG